MRFDPSLIVNEGPEVYRPAEDSFLLLRSIEVASGDRFLEVGTGTGLIAVHAARTAHVLATDLNPVAVRLAAANARSNSVRMSVLRCDLMSAVRGSFDVVAFNPPYLEGSGTDDLERAWQGGWQGGEVSIRFLRGLPGILAPRGRAYVVMSRANREARAAAESAFRVRTVASSPLFFETLDVLEVRPPGPPPGVLPKGHQGLP